MIGIGGGDFKTLPANGIKPILPLDTAHSLVVDQDPCCRPRRDTVAWKLFLGTFDVVF
jgi:hypothetical protein